MIYIVSGAPGEGKSFYGSFIALMELKHGEKVMTNYPVIWKKPLTIAEKIKNYQSGLYNRYMIKLFPFKNGVWMGSKCKMKRPLMPLIINKLVSSYKWRDEYMDLGIHGWTVILDEAYTIVSSRDWAKFDQTKHTFFATNRHDENHFYFLTQHFSRIDTILRQMANYYIFVSKKTFPWSVNPLFFVLDFYVGKGKDETFNEDERKMRDILTFRKDVRECYDTHYYKHKELNVKYSTWLTEGFKPS